MSGAEMLPKWSSTEEESALKLGSMSACLSGFRVSMKDYVAWHSRLSNLIFLCVLLGVGALLGVVTTLNAVGYLSDPESGFLSTSFTALPPHLDVLMSSDQTSRPTAVDLLLRSSNTTSEGVRLQSSPMASQVANVEVLEPSVEETYVPFVDDGSYVERVEVLPSFGSDFALMPHPVDLAPLSDVYHDISEAELLWRASVDTLRRPRPDSVTPKVAFMFLTRGPLPLGPLWERYFKGHNDLYSIYIHAHPNYMPFFPSDSVFYRRNIPSKV